MRYLPWILLFAAGCSAPDPTVDRLLPGGKALVVDGVVSPVLITAGPPSVAHVLFPQPGATVTVIDDRAGNWKRHYRLVQVTLESGPGLGQTGTMERQYPRLAQ